ncbi:MAG TPA: cytochrome c [Stellaceae bacterium]|nr:cytochrome c [Stellaceae bacterium]
MPITRHQIIAIGALPLALLAPALARADAAKGAQLAQLWCASCHVIGNSAANPVQVGPPSFPAIAKGNLSAARLRAFLTKPHGSMPDLSLTRAEISDLVAYIETLR